MAHWREGGSVLGAPRATLLVFAATFGLYLLGLSPSLGFRDSGELSTAAATLGVAHETGFPLFCLLGRALALLPLGEAATRIALLSALSGATAVALLHRLLLRLHDGSTVAGVGALLGASLLGLDDTMWRQATVTEVYAPTAAAILLALLLLAAHEDAAQAQRSVRAGRLALTLWLVAGLALGLHASFRLLLLPPLALHALVALRRGARWPLLAPLCFALGALVLAYLPVAAAREPLADWGDPRSLGGLVDHLLASRIRRAFAGEILARDPALVARHLRAFLAIAEAQLGLPALLLAPLGLFLLALRPAARAVGLCLGAILVGDVAYSAWINPMGIDDLQCGVPSAIALSAGAAAGVVEVSRRLLRGGASVEGPLDRLLPVGVTAGLAAILLVPALLSAPGQRFAAGPQAAAWTLAALRDAPSRALVLTRSDDLSAGALYAQAVWGLRPDVSVLVRQELWDAAYVERVLARSDVGGGVLREEERRAWRRRSEAARLRGEPDFLRNLVAANIDRRAVLWEPADDPPPLGHLAADAPLALLDVDLQPMPAVRPLVDRIERLLGGGDPSATSVQAVVLGGLGAAWAAAGVDDRAAPLLEIALRLAPERLAPAVNLAVLRARRGDAAGALGLLEEVLSREPDRTLARLNAGRLRLVLGDPGGAEEDFRRAALELPAAAAPQVGLARVARARGDLPAALRLVEEAARRDPGDPEARALLLELRPLDAPPPPTAP